MTELVSVQSYKEFGHCGKCGVNFEKVHHAQLYCPECRGILSVIIEMVSDQSYKEFGHCSKCGVNFEKVHHLQLYCPECRGFLSVKMNRRKEQTQLNKEALK